MLDLKKPLSIITNKKIILFGLVVPELKLQNILTLLVVLRSISIMIN